MPKELLRHLSRGQRTVQTGQVDKKKTKGEIKHKKANSHQFQGHQVRDWAQRQGVGMRIVIMSIRPWLCAELSQLYPSVQIITLSWIHKNWHKYLRHLIGFRTGNLYQLCCSFPFGKVNWKTKHPINKKAQSLSSFTLYYIIAHSIAINLKIIFTHSNSESLSLDAGFKAILPHIERETRKSGEGKPQHEAHINTRILWLPWFSHPGAVVGRVFGKAGVQYV